MKTRDMMTAGEILFLVASHAADNIHYTRSSHCERAGFSKDQRHAQEENAAQVEESSIQKSQGRYMTQLHASDACHRVPSLLDLSTLIGEAMGRLHSVHDEHASSSSSSSSSSGYSALNSPGGSSNNSIHALHSYQERESSYLLSKESLLHPADAHGVILNRGEVVSPSVTKTSKEEEMEKKLEVWEDHDLGFLLHNIRRDIFILWRSLYSADELDMVDDVDFCESLVLSIARAGQREKYVLTRLGIIHSLFFPSSTFQRLFYLLFLPCFTALSTLTASIPTSTLILLLLCTDYSFFHFFLVIHIFSSIFSPLFLLPLYLFSCY